MKKTKATARRPVSRYPVKGGRPKVHSSAHTGSDARCDGVRTAAAATNRRRSPARSLARRSEARTQDQRRPRSTTAERPARAACMRARSGSTTNRPSNERLDSTDDGRSTEWMSAHTSLKGIQSNSTARLLATARAVSDFSRRRRRCRRKRPSVPALSTVRRRAQWPTIYPKLRHRLLARS